MKMRLEVTVNIGRYENVRVAAEDDSDNYTDYAVGPIAACQDALKREVVACLMGLGGDDPGVKKEIESYLNRVFGVGKNVAQPVPGTFDAGTVADTAVAMPQGAAHGAGEDTQAVAANGCGGMQEPAVPTGVKCDNCGNEIMDGGSLQSSRLLIGRPLCRACFKVEIARPEAKK